MNLKKEMLQSVSRDADSILQLEGAEAEARTLGFINHDQKANDVLYWMGAIDRDEAELLEYQKSEIDRINRFTDAKLKTLHTRRDFFKSALESYFRTCKGKTLSLSNGKIGKRKQPDRVVVDNEEDFTKWWLDSPSTANELVKTIHKPVLKEIKAYIQDSGECPDGGEYIEGKPQFYVRAEEL